MPELTPEEHSGAHTVIGPATKVPLALVVTMLGALAVAAGFIWTQLLNIHGDMASIDVRMTRVETIIQDRLGSGPRREAP